MQPLYYKNYLSNILTTPLETIFSNIDLNSNWVTEQYLREESFMADIPTKYQYIENGPIYKSTPFNPIVKEIMQLINTQFNYNMNVCFLNKYIDHTKGLNWHSDDGEKIDQSEPICVVSLGEEREIWFREKDKKGVVLPEERQLLNNGSLFIMPPGMQDTHLHRIPKGDKEMKTRISLTYRKWNY